MPLTFLLFAGLIFVIAAVVAMLFALGIVGQSSKVVRARLAVAQPAASAAGGGKSAVIRTHRPKGGLTNFFATGTSLAKIERSLLLAGRPNEWTLSRVVLAKFVLTIVGIFFMLVQISGGISLPKVVFSLLGVFAAYFVPDVLIKRRADERQLTIQQELPDVLDQVTISIEAGMGFEAAFARIGDRRSGPLADEIVRTVQDMRLGMSRRDAYQAMADRTDVDDLRKFVKSITQAEKFGVSVSSVVRTQAIEMRFKRRTRAEGKALQVPVKILFPMFTCIFPVLFIVILTPAVMNLSATLSTH